MVQKKKNQTQNLLLSLKKLHRNKSYPKSFLALIPINVAEKCDAFTRRSGGISCSERRGASEHPQGSAAASSARVQNSRCPRSYAFFHSLVSFYIKKGKTLLL